MKKILWLAALFVSAQTSYGQHVCGGVYTPPGAQGGQGTQATDCSGSGPDYNNFYRHLESYIPTLETAEKIIHVNVIVWQEDDGTTNWQNTPSQIARLNNILSLVNSQWLDKDQSPTDPVAGVVELPNLDKRFHMKVEGIYFIPNSTEAHTSNFSGKVQYLLANNPELLKQVNIHITNSPHSYPGAQGWSNGSRATYPAIVTSDDTHGTGYNCNTATTTSACPISMPNNFRDWQFAHHLAHELAHNLDLLHVYQGQNETCNSSDHDYMDDLFPLNAPYCNPPSPINGCDACLQNLGTPPVPTPPQLVADVSPNDSWTNNLMNGAEGRYITPKQAGKAHRALALHNISNFTSGYSETPLEITQNETWNFPMQLYRTLVIKSGNTLTVKCELRMPERGTIQIEPGAELIIDGGHITKSNSNAADWWGGIYVEGNSNTPQSEASQGKITMVNAAKISHARDGITNIAIDANGGWLWGTTGGIIEVEDAFFENNRRDVQLLAYVPPFSKNATYRGFFKNTSFTRNDNFNVEAMISSITMWGVAGIIIDGCDFINSHTGDFQYDGGAILTINSSYRVHEHNGTGCHFEGYADAIKSESDFSIAHPLRIVGATFTDNIHSIYLNQTQNAKVAYNTISARTNHSFVPPGGAPFQNIAYGIYLDYSSGFGLHDNVLDNLDGTNTLSAGIVVKDNCGASDEVYYNVVDGFYYGMQAIGNNRNSFNIDLGLQYKCNDLGDNSINIVDIMVDQNGDIAASQGSTTSFPNNLFSPVTTNRHFDNFGPLIKYNHSSALSRSEPVNYLGLSVVPSSSPSNYTTECNSLPKPSIFSDPTLGYNAVLTADVNLENLRDLKMQLTDEGSTAELEAEILFANDQDEYQVLYIDMMNMSPYVSEENLLNVVSLEEFPELALRNIMVANPHSSRSENVWNALLDKTPPLSQQTLDDIENELQTITAKDVLDMDISHTQQNSEYLSQQLIGYYSENMAAEEVYLQDLKEHLEYRDEEYFRYALVDLLLSEGDVASVNDVLSAIESDCDLGEREAAEFSLMQDYYSILTSALEEDTRLDELGSDKIDALVALDEGELNSGFAVGKARALLRLNDVEVSYIEPIIEAGAGKRNSRLVSNSDRPSFPESSFKLYPNPANENTILQWNWLTDGLQDGFEVSLQDMEGKSVLATLVGDHQVNTKMINVSAVASGMYILVVRQEDKVLFRTKLTVQ